MEKDTVDQSHQEKSTSREESFMPIGNTPGLLQVTAPVKGSNTNNCIMYTNKEQIKLACLEEAHCHFTQATDTPMLQKPMIACISIANVDSAAFQQILDRTFKCPSTCDPITKRLLKQLAGPAGVVDNHT